jgi:hypothetical protein
MSTADKLSYLAQTKTAIKDAIVEKGVAISSSDTFRSYADKIRIIPTGGGGSGGGADKVFVENKSGVEYSKGDKVLVNFINVDGIDVGDTFDQHNYFHPSWVLHDGTIKLNDSTFQKGYNIVYTPNGFSETSYPQSGFRGVGYPYRFEGDYFITQSPVSTGKYSIQNIKTGETTSYEDFPLTDNILWDFDKGLLYNSDKSQSYDTGLGNATNTQKMLQPFGNIIVYTYLTEVHFIDVSDFPNCTKKIYKLPMSFETNRGVTGTNVGDYYIGAYKGTYHLLRFNGSGYEYDKMIVTKSNTYDFINLSDKIFGFVETDGTPVAYCLENGEMKKLDIPIDVLNTIKADTSLDTYNRQGFSFNKDFSVVSWDWSLGNYINYSRYAYIKDGASIYISNPISDNFNYNSSFTGYATGEVDALGRLEVEMCLPEKVELTVITNVDVNDNDIVFEGAVV